MNAIPERARALVAALSEATDIACPTWCDHAGSGHAYRHNLAEPGLYRTHRTELADLRAWGLSLERTQVERAASPTGPVLLDAEEVTLSALEPTTEPPPLTPGRLHQLARALAAAADHLTTDAKGETL